SQYDDEHDDRTGKQSFEAVYAKQHRADQRPEQEAERKHGPEDCIGHHRKARTVRIYRFTRRGIQLRHGRCSERCKQNIGRCKQPDIADDEEGRESDDHHHKCSEYQVFTVKFESVTLPPYYRIHAEAANGNKRHENTVCGSGHAMCLRHEYDQERRSQGDGHAEERHVEQEKFIVLYLKKVSDHLYHSFIQFVLGCVDKSPDKCQERFDLRQLKHTVIKCDISVPCNRPVIKEHFVKIELVLIKIIQHNFGKHSHTDAFEQQCPACCNLIDFNLRVIFPVEALFKKLLYFTQIDGVRLELNDRERPVPFIRFRRHKVVLVDEQQFILLVHHAVPANDRDMEVILFFNDLL